MPNNKDIWDESPMCPNCDKYSWSCPSFHPVRGRYPGPVHNLISAIIIAERVDKDRTELWALDMLKLISDWK